MQDYTYRKVLILDTAAFIAAAPLYLYDKLLYTTPSVINEVKDSESVQRLMLAQAVDRLIIEEPSKEFIKKAVDAAKRLKIFDKLSKTDIDVLALALQLLSKGFNVTVLTDDYDLQKVLKSMGIDFKAVKTIGIK
ncbi:DNA-binding protein [Ignisphaera sp. 4213-co]|uniref:Endoribonuclease Nob1 n=1 Tax=Ignisphaera cupida TaxID=3050454 RepID=A0ABD4Z539_9CREN|nr:DNA-binding protein [Ignisphaera sp. 4213-co]MDK6028432.1 DNA-binding protein [Ignisphaera sp. 4213-co]